ncbi:reverse transcriptase/ribonuclease [Salix suchowensis]|nr:reverse transcriptase/ribonuclease [Salix suchowensis]
MPHPTRSTMGIRALCVISPDASLRAAQASSKDKLKEAISKSRQISRILLLESFAMQLNGDQPPQTEPTGHRHVSKTHCNTERVAEISLLDVEEKDIENMFIRARNRQKLKARENRLANPDVDAPSDDESLITVPSRPATPPTTPPQTPLPTLRDSALASLGSAIQSLSPRSLMQTILGKRTLDNEESREERIKHLKMASAPEIRRAPGQVLVLSHKTELLELEAAGMYMPLTLFTRTGELVLADHLDDVRTIRRNSKPGEKRNLYIDVNDKRFERELDLSQEAWTFASDEMVEWARDAKSDDRLHIRFGQHFGWLKYQLADGRDFSLVRELDIKLRKEYRRQPFEFSGDIYSEELRNLSVKRLELRMAAEMALLRSQTTSLAGPSRSTFSEPLPSRGRARGFGRPFQSFQSGQARPPRTLSASSALDEDTELTHVPSKPFQEASPSRLAMSTARPLSQTASHAAFPGTRTAGKALAALPTESLTCSTYAPSVSPPTTTHSHSPASLTPREPAGSPPLPPMNPPTHLSSDPSILLRIETPYDANAFDSFLSRFPAVLKQYPYLTYKLRHGFSMGSFPNLKETIIWPNAPSVLQYMPFIDEYFAEEVSANRLSGPYTQSEVEAILGSPFQCSPLTVDSQPQEGAEPKLRLCINLSKRSKAHPATNDHSDRRDFPTRFDSALQVSDAVSTVLFPHSVRAT